GSGARCGATGRCAGCDAGIAGPEGRVQAGEAACGAVAVDRGYLGGTPARAVEHVQGQQPGRLAEGPRPEAAVFAGDLVRPVGPGVLEFGDPSEVACGQSNVDVETERAGELAANHLA